MVNIDFTLTKFSKLCTAVAQNYHTLTLARYFQGEKLPERFAICATTSTGSRRMSSGRYAMLFDMQESNF